MKRSSCNRKYKTTKRTLSQLQQPNEALERHRHREGKPRTPSLLPKLEAGRRRVSRTKTSSPQRSSTRRKLSSRRLNLLQSGRRRGRGRVLPREDLEFPLLRSCLLLCRPHNSPSLPSRLKYMAPRLRISQRLSMIDRERPTVKHLP